MYYTVIKHDGQGKCRNTSRKRVFSTFLECLGMFKSQCNTWVRLLRVLYDIGIM